TATGRSRRTGSASRRFRLARKPGILAHPLLQLLLALDQRGARQQQHRIALDQADLDLGIVEVGKSGLDVHRRGLAMLHREDDVAAAEAVVTATAPATTTASASSPATT